MKVNLNLPLKFKYQGYRGKAVYNKKLGVYEGVVTNSNSLISFVGKKENIEQEFRVSIDEYLQFCEEQEINASQHKKQKPAIVIKLKLLKKQFEVDSELGKKANQLASFQKFVDRRNSKLRKVNGGKILFWKVNEEPFYRIAIQDRPDLPHWHFATGMSAKKVDQIKYEILKNL